jgi:hypothetical protein
MATTTDIGFLYCQSRFLRLPPDCPADYAGFLIQTSDNAACGSAVFKYQKALT